MRVRIGIANATRELDLEVDDAESVVTEYERADQAGERMFTIEESDGRKHVVLVAAVLYIEFDPNNKGAVGFSPE